MDEGTQKGGKKHTDSGTNQYVSALRQDIEEFHDVRIVLLFCGEAYLFRQSSHETVFYSRQISHLRRDGTNLVKYDIHQYSIYNT